MTSKKFLGIKQVSSTAFAAVDDADKVGYIWFVRTAIKDDTDAVTGYESDIYFGSRLYTHCGDIKDLESLIGTIPADADAKTVVEYIDEKIQEAQFDSAPSTVTKVTKKTATSSSDNDTYQLANASGDTIVGSDFTIEYDTTLGDDIATVGAIGGVKSGTKVSDIKDKSISDIIDMILFPEVYPTAATKPGVSSVNGGAASDSVVTLGSTVTIDSVTASLTTGKFNATFSEPAAEYTHSLEITYAKTGMTNYDPTEGGESIAKDTDTVAQLGANTITWTAKETYSAPTNKPKTSYGNETEVTSANTSATWTASTSSKTKSTTVQGVYPVFSNIASGTLADEATTQAALTSGSTVTLEGVPSEVSASKHFILEYPTGRGISFKVKDLQGNYVDYAATYSTNVGVAKHTINGVEYVYDRLVTTGAFQGSGDYRFVFTVALNA